MVVLEASPSLELARETQEARPEREEGKQVRRAVLDARRSQRGRAAWLWVNPPLGALVSSSVKWGNKTSSKSHLTPDRRPDWRGDGGDVLLA